MSTSKMLDCNGFNESLMEMGLQDKLNDIATLIEVADRGNHWTTEFYGQAMEKAKKAELRRLLRSGFRDENGDKVEFFGIQEVDPETGAIHEGYKQLSFFTLDNFEYAIGQCDRAMGEYQSKRHRLVKLARLKFGDEAQARFEFEPDLV